MMHGFALLLVAVLSHPHARTTVASAQRIVTYFRASTRPYALLREAAKSLTPPVNTTLLTSTKTRFTSVHLMLESVLKLERAFTVLLAQNAGARACSALLVAGAKRMLFACVVRPQGGVLGWTGVLLPLGWVSTFKPQHPLRPVAQTRSKTPTCPRFWRTPRSCPRRGTCAPSWSR
jgi:hypothetical protein